MRSVPAARGGDRPPESGIHVIRMPENYGPLSPLLHVVPLQLLAYHTAYWRGTDAKGALMSLAT